MNSSKAMWMVFGLMVGAILLVYLRSALRWKESSLRQMTVPERIARVLLALFLIGYAAHGILAGHVWIPGKWRNFDLHGDPAMAMCAAFVCAAAAVGTGVVGYYDRRHGERGYRIAAVVAGITGWVLFALALALNLNRNP